LSEPINKHDHDQPFMVFWAAKASHVSTHRDLMLENSNVRNNQNRNPSCQRLPAARTVLVELPKRDTTSQHRPHHQTQRKPPNYSTPEHQEFDWNGIQLKPVSSTQVRKGGLGPPRAPPSAFILQLHSESTAWGRNPSPSPSVP
jgi:hypothetical protein